MQLRPAHAPDLVDAMELLRAAGLPCPGPEDPAVTLFVAVEAGEVVACAGFERHAGMALVRSVAVRADRRGRGAGRQAVTRVLEELDRHGVPVAYLVTLDAAAFFERLGFVALDRADVPAAIQSSPEWSLHACVGGTWMRRGR
ncbi:MAG: GNAT family N-acetyltransferase [Gemmatimonadetes bacterium]|nr:GNAT family N-acetyltransferase [Gemmatimonadota bacterium]